MSNQNLPEIDIERVKNYNATLKVYMDKGSNLQAEMEFNKKELAKACQELSLELGMEVTPENIEQIYVDRVSKIENTLVTGEGILQRIYMEETGQVVVNNGAPVGQINNGAPVGQINNGAPVGQINNGAPVGQINNGSMYNSAMATGVTGVINTLTGENRQEQVIRPISI